MQHAADALNYLHSEYRRLNAERETYLCHRDVKPANMLLRGEVLKLSDFGTTATVRHDPTKHCGTLRYLLHKGEVYTAANDIYSWALCFYYALSNVEPYAAYSDRALEYAVNKVRDVCLKLFSIQLNFSERNCNRLMRHSTSSSVTLMARLLRKYVH
jgi:serine/threonine protein kinase